jgi:hypothetical protein
MDALKAKLKKNSKKNIEVLGTQTIGMIDGLGRF